LSEVLKELYEKITDVRLHKEIIDFIFSTFNLVDDFGEHWHYAPPSIFEILRTYGLGDPLNRLLKLKKHFIAQLQSSFNKHGQKYKGIEVISFDEDQNFVTKVLNPIMKDAFMN